VDAAGLLLAVVSTAASIRDRDAGLAERPPACEDVGDLPAQWEHTPGQDSK
jgi:hypothetical protein